MPLGVGGREIRQLRKPASQLSTLNTSRLSETSHFDAPGARRWSGCGIWAHTKLDVEARGQADKKTVARREQSRRRHFLGPQERRKDVKTEMMGRRLRVVKGVTAVEAVGVGVEDFRRRTSDDWKPGKG